MILVVVGTERWPFDRLVAKVDELAASGAFGEHDVFVQLGHCTVEPRACAFERFISYGEMVAKVRAASLVIGHAGAGTFVMCRQLGTPEIVMPRRHARGEHVDDHQVQFAHELHARNVVTTVDEADELGDAVARVLANAAGAAHDVARPLALAQRLREQIAAWSKSSASIG